MTCEKQTVESRTLFPLLSMEISQHSRTVLAHQKPESQLKNSQLSAIFNELQAQVDSYHAKQQTADTDKDLKRALGKAQLEMIRVNGHWGHPSRQVPACKAPRSQLGNLSPAIRRIDTIEQDHPGETFELADAKEDMEELKKKLMAAEEYPQAQKLNMATA
ncbi:hypothetical protein BDZ45DRAFT_694577 [Acephala macrosclerotiorum]|nr:hypothetical protein BDZ45DRAFT_694577 [Acephala macrosclerotiorum]